MQGVHDAHSERPNAGEPAQARTRGLARWLTPPRLRRLAGLRPYLGILTLLVLPLTVVALDWGRRRSRILEFEGEYRLTYLAALVESVMVWGLLLYAASRQRGYARIVPAVLLVAFATFAIGGQTYFFEQYHAYLNVDVSVFASNFMDSVVNQLFADIGNYLEAKLPVLLLALGLIWLARRTVRPRRKVARVAVWLAPVLLIASFFIPTQHQHVQASTPDVPAP